LNNNDPDLDIKILELAEEINPIFFERLKST